MQIRRITVQSSLQGCFSLVRVFIANALFFVKGLAQSPLIYLLESHNMGDIPSSLWNKMKQRGKEANKRKH